MKTILVALCFLFAIPAFALGQVCPNASPVNAPNFCSSFKTAASCNCSATLPKSFCNQMRPLYSRMTSMFGTLERACSYQKKTSKEECMDDWNCYLKGGTTPSGLVCSGDGHACE